MIPKGIKELDTYCKTKNKKVVLGRTSYGTIILKGVVNND